MNVQVESDENNVADEKMDISGSMTHDLHEDGGNVEPQTQTEPITTNNAANRRVRRTEVVSRDERFQCQDCERTFSGPSGLWQHTKSKHEGVKYACNHCDHQFTLQGVLTKHIQSIHEGVKYACNQCDYQATRQDSLTSHIQYKHEGVKYACDQCAYQATTQSSLTRHMKKHL